MTTKHFTRREFLTRAPASAAAVGLAGCAGSADRRGESGEDVSGGVWEKPPDQRDKGNRLNLILLDVDTFRADNLACYGGNQVGLFKPQRFRPRQRHLRGGLPEALPTVPIRRNLVTGRRIVPFDYYQQHDPVQMPGWHPLFFEDVTLAETLHEAGYATALIADILHFTRPGRNFHRGYRYYDWVRGHSFDFYAPCLTNCRRSPT